MRLGCCSELCSIFQSCPSSDLYSSFLNKCLCNLPFRDNFSILSAKISPKCVHSASYCTGSLCYPYAAASNVQSLRSDDIAIMTTSSSAGSKQDIELSSIATIQSNNELVTTQASNKKGCNAAN
jgi:hypothetical protein